MINPHFLSETDAPKKPHTEESDKATVYRRHVSTSDFGKLRFASLYWNRNIHHLKGCTIGYNGPIYYTTVLEVAEGYIELGKHVVHAMLIEDAILEFIRILLSHCSPTREQKHQDEDR